MLKLADKVAIVTGSSQGIGRGIALSFAREGADIVVNCDKNVEAARKVAEEIRYLGRRALVIKADVSKSKEVGQMVEETLKTYKKIDILVNNAGISISKTIKDLTEEEWDRVIDINLKGVFLCSQAVGKHMIKRKSGTIINLASIAGHIPEIFGGAYTPSKAGVLGLTALLALEWAKYGIRVNSISPGPILTPLQKRTYADKDLFEARNMAVPMKRHGEPEEIGKIAVFLASQDSSYITGQTIIADGGSLISMFHLVRMLTGKT